MLVWNSRWPRSLSWLCGWGLVKDFLSQVCRVNALCRVVKQQWDFITDINAALCESKERHEKTLNLTNKVWTFCIFEVDEIFLNGINEFKLFLQYVSIVRDRNSLNYYIPLLGRADSFYQVLTLLKDFLIDLNTRLLVFYSTLLVVSGRRVEHRRLLLSSRGQAIVIDSGPITARRSDWQLFGQVSRSFRSLSASKW